MPCKSSPDKEDVQGKASPFFYVRKGGFHGRTLRDEDKPPGRRQASRTKASLRDEGKPPGRIQTSRTKTSLRTDTEQHKTHNTRHKAQDAKHKTQSAKRKTESAKRKAQNTKRKTQEEANRLQNPTKVYARGGIKKERETEFLSLCGADEARTRDPMRDRHVF